MDWAWTLGILLWAWAANGVPPSGLGQPPNGLGAWAGKTLGAHFYLDWRRPGVPSSNGLLGLDSALTWAGLLTALAGDPSLI